MGKRTCRGGSETRPSAMVAPPPSKVYSFLDWLDDICNDRAYTVISHKGNTWVIQLEGDDKPKTIKVEDTGWVVK
jgi:hypothetical protein